jgi:uncharacterized membrane protein
MDATSIIARICSRVGVCGGGGGSGRSGSVMSSAASALVSKMMRCETSSGWSTAMRAAGSAPREWPATIARVMPTARMKAYAWRMIPSIE